MNCWLGCELHGLSAANTSHPRYGWLRIMSALIFLTSNEYELNGFVKALMIVGVRSENLQVTLRYPILIDRPACG